MSVMTSFYPLFLGLDMAYIRGLSRVGKWGSVEGEGVSSLGKGRSDPGQRQSTWDRHSREEKRMGMDY